LKVKLDPETIEVCLKPFNIITPEKFQTAIEKHDSLKRINFHNYKVIYILKKFDNHYLLIDCRNERPDEITVFKVFILGEQLIKTISIDNTLSVLEKFVNEFGYQIKIGDQIGKFIQDAEIKIPYDHSNNLQKKIEDNIEITDNGKPITSPGIISTVVNSKILDGIEHIELAFFYSINYGKYVNYLKSNNLM
jgi:hypothetical protein